MYHDDFSLPRNEQKEAFSNLNTATRIAGIGVLIPMIFLANHIPIKIFLPLTFLLDGFS